MRALWLLCCAVLWQSSSCHSHCPVCLCVPPRGRITVPTLAIPHSAALRRYMYSTLPHRIPVAGYGIDLWRILPVDIRDTPGIEEIYM